jgi:cell division septation protein DedD
MEKMPSASNSPIIGRKVSSEDVNSKKGQPLSVASMVRRFERDTGLEHKNRGGESQLERSNSSLNKESSKSVVKESRSSSRNSSLDSSQGNISAAVSSTEIEAVVASSAEAVVSEVKPIQTQKASTSKTTTTKTATTKAATTSVAVTTSETSAKPSKTVSKFIFGLKQFYDSSVPRTYLQHIQQLKWDVMERLDGW